jgi:hypothetical protein
MKPKPQILTGRVFRIYFESLYTTPKVGEWRTTCCIVIARDATDAMAKTLATFPAERVNSLHEENRHYSGEHMIEKIVI